MSNYIFVLSRSTLALFRNIGAALAILMILGWSSVGIAAQEFFCTFPPPAPQGWTDCGFSEQGPLRTTIVTEVSRDGISAVRLHTEGGDTNVAGSRSNERNDLGLSGGRTGCPGGGACEGREQWWAHSILFPSDYRAPDPGGWGIAFDFHNTANQCHPDGFCQANFHVDATARDSQAPDGRLQFRGYGRMSVNDPVVEYRAAIDNLQKGVWYDFVYHVRWSSKPNSDPATGFFDAWVRKHDEPTGRKLLTYRGPTLYGGEGVYLKLANYHTVFTPPQPSSIIHDRVIRGTTADDVSSMPLSSPSQGAYEESVATYAGSLWAWNTSGPEVGIFSGGQILHSRTAGSTASFSFTGTAVSWVGVKCNVCGMATVSIDGGAPTTVDTAGPAAPGSLTSEAVFSVSGLAPGEHIIVISVTGTHSVGSTDNYIAVDGFNVM